MNFKKILKIYKKELLDIMRDRRTVITAIVLPIILYPILMIGYTSILSRQEIKLEDKGAKVYVSDAVKNSKSKLIIEYLQAIDNFKIITDLKKQDPQKEYNAKKVDAIVEISLEKNKVKFVPLIVKIIFDISEDKSKLAYEKIQTKLGKVKAQLIAIRLHENKISEKIINVLKVEKENTAGNQKMFGFVIGKILPYLIIMMIISGASVVAIDIVAGEKERGTLETLLVSAASRLELVVGKYLTVITVTFITLLLNLVSLFLSLRHVVSQSGIKIQGAELPIFNFFLVFILMIPVITLFASILLSISTYSRNIREATLYISPLMIASMMMALISTLPGINLNVGLALIPIVNFSLLFKDIMMNNFNLTFFIITISSTIVLDIIAIYISISLFKKESILFRVAEDKSLKFWGKKNRGNIFSIQFALLFYITLLLLFFFVGGDWQKADLIRGLQKTLVFIVFLPTLALLLISRQNVKKVARLNMPRLANIPLAILIMIPSFIIVASINMLINLVFPFPEKYVKFFQNFMGCQNTNILLLLLTIAILPGICEEFLFRGYILRVFEKKGFWYSIIISALLFAIFHLDPYRFIPVTLLGILLGYLLKRTDSIFITMIAHFTNNSIVLLMPKTIEQTLFQNTHYMIILFLCAVILFAFIIYLIEKINKEDCEMDALLE